MVDETIARSEDLESRAKKVLGIIRDKGVEVVDPSSRICDLEMRQAYLFGLKKGVFTYEEIDEAQRAYWSKRQTTRYT